MTEMASTSIVAGNVSSTTYIRSKPIDLPLDMSFMNLSAIEAYLLKLIKAFTFSLVENFKKDMSKISEFVCVADLTSIQEPRPVGNKGQSPQKNEADKYMTRVIRLNNNFFSELTSFQSTMETIMAEPYLLSWIDLSFNSLQTIDDVFCQFRNLQILYLHGNTIMKLNEVDKLIELPHLSKLTLHGNPIENDKSYRLYVLTRVPQLRNFDMTAVTRGDRLTANIWQKNMPIKKKKSRMSNDI